MRVWHGCPKVINRAIHINWGWIGCSDADIAGASRIFRGQIQPRDPILSAHHDHSGHPHGHGHDHHHGDHHAPPSAFGPAFALAIALNSLFVAIEFGYGLAANSTALIADAGHNLSDVLGLALAWLATRLARKAPNSTFTYGLRSSSVLAALANAVFLLLACGGIAWEAMGRFGAPHPVDSAVVMGVAAAGIAVNGFSAWLFLRGSKGDVNIRGAYLHMAADAAVSLGVVAAGAAIWYTGWSWLDPALSLVIVAVVVAGTWGLLRESLGLALHAVPPHVDAPAIEAYLKALPGVASLHDLHIWGMSTTESALTVHLVTPAGYPGDAFMDTVVHTLAERFSIHHATLQAELGTTDHACALGGSGQRAQPFGLVRQ